MGAVFVVGDQVGVERQLQVFFVADGLLPVAGAAPFQVKDGELAVFFEDDVGAAIELNAEKTRFQRFFGGQYFPAVFPDQGNQTPRGIFELADKAGAFRFHPVQQQHSPFFSQQPDDFFFHPALDVVFAKGVQLQFQQALKKPVR